MYYLYPPFFVVPESSNFAEGWESFCCKLLNLHHKTSQIYQRVPPEQGVDLFYPSKAIAYQCKSVESGKSGDFNVQSALKSIDSAKRAAASIGWKQYCLCTNVGLTGTAERRLMKKLPGTILHPKSFWTGLCEKFPTQVRRNFRVVLSLPSPERVKGMTTSFHDYYPPSAQRHLKKNSFDVFFWSERNDRIYELPVSNSITVKEVLAALRSFFGFPDPGEWSSDGVRLSLLHSLLFDGKKLTESMTMKKAGIAPGSLVTYQTGVAITSSSGRISMESLNIQGDSVKPTGTVSSEAASLMLGFIRQLMRCFKKTERLLKANY